MSLVFYDDSQVFGGHEVMMLLGLKAVLDDYSEPVRFLAASTNEKLCDKISALARDHPQLTLEPVPWQSSKLEALRNRILPLRVNFLANRLREIHPALVVAIQGNIEHSSLALLACRRIGIQCTSYIPVPHSNAEMNARLGAIRDCFCTHLFRLPNSFVTITDEMARLLKQQGAIAPIHIVYNGVDTDRFQPGNRQSACHLLNLPNEKIRIGVIGRIEFRQKQQDLLIRSIAQNPVLSETCHLVFAGDGPDVLSLQELIEKYHLSATVLPWCDPALLYQALDALVIPSRYEGLPLVMLEALSSGTTVLGSDRDGMKDVLPENRRFAPNDTSALAKTISLFISEGCPSPSEGLRDRVRRDMSLLTFNRSFSSTILSLAGVSK